MSRYIDADALIKEIKMDIEDEGLQERRVFYRINDAPSIDIVRCKECRHWTKWSSDGEMFCGCLDGGIGSDADDYCSYGERREP